MNAKKLRGAFTCLSILSIPVFSAIGLYLVWGRGFWWCVTAIIGGILLGILASVLTYLVDKYLTGVETRRWLYPEEMTEPEHALGPLIRDLSWMLAVETQDYMTPDERRKFPWTSTRQREFLNSFADEKFVFEGDICSLCIGWTFISEELNGCLGAAIYDKPESVWGEKPPVAGTILLEYRNGKPCIKVKKYRKAKGSEKVWSNQNWKDNSEELESESMESRVFFSSYVRGD